jgi:hypothetical protein
MKAGALAIAGSGRLTNRDGSSDILTQPETIFAAFHRTVARGNVLEVRGYTRTMPRALPLDEVRQGTGIFDPPSTLWVKGGLPTGLNLRTLRKLLSEFEVQWKPTEHENVLRDMAWAGHAELLLTTRDCGRLSAVLAASDANGSGQQHLARISVPLQPWLLEQHKLIAPRSSNLYRPIKLEELLYFDEEVVRPVAAAALAGTRLDQLSDDIRQSLEAASAAATSLNYQLQVVHDLGSGAEFLVLSERASVSKRRCWGTFVFRFSESTPCVVVNPRPLAEQYTFEYAISLFSRVQARTLLLAGSHPEANLDGVSDLARPANKVNLLNLIHQVVLRESGSQPMVVVHVRAFGAPIDADVVVATFDPEAPAPASSKLAVQIADCLRADGLRIRMADGSSDAAGYETGSAFVADSLRLTQNKSLVTLWLSPDLRMRYRAQIDDDLQAAQFQTLRIPTVQTSLVGYLTSFSVEAAPIRMPPETLSTIVKYLYTRDILLLRRLQVDCPETQWTRLFDTESGQAYLVGRQGIEQWPLVVSLAELPRGGPKPAVLHEIDSRQVRDFVANRATWIEWERRP